MPADPNVYPIAGCASPYGAGASLGLPVIGKLLGHTQAATTHRYAHLDADPLRRAAETIGATIAAAMDRPLRQKLGEAGFARATALCDVSSQMSRLRKHFSE